MLATSGVSQGETSPFSETFKQKTGRLFSIDTLLDSQATVRSCPVAVFASHLRSVAHFIVVSLLSDPFLMGLANRLPLYLCLQDTPCRIAEE